MKRSHELLTGFPVITPVSIIWADEDAFGHVNNVMYVRWCETARGTSLRIILHVGANCLADASVLAAQAQQLPHCPWFL